MDFASLFDVPDAADLHFPPVEDYFDDYVEELQCVAMDTREDELLSGLLDQL